MIERALLDELLRQAPSQPATSLWRAVEVGHLIRSRVLPLEGRGLDLGCGDGRVTLVLQRELKANWCLVGLDSDEAELDLASDLGLYAELHLGLADSIPKPDSSLDFVLSNSVLEHIAGVRAVLDEVARVLRPDGRFVVTVPTQALHELLRGPNMLGRLVTGQRGRQGYLEALDRRLAHLNLWGERRWREALAGAGLAVEHVSPYFTHAEVRRWETISNLTAGVLTGAVGHGRKPIELQRDLGLRRSAPPDWLVLVGRLVGHAAALGLDGLPKETAPYACILLVARKTVR